MKTKDDAMDTDTVEITPAQLLFIFRSMFHHLEQLPDGSFPGDSFSHSEELSPRLVAKMYKVVHDDWCHLMNSVEDIIDELQKICDATVQKKVDELAAWERKYYETRSAGRKRREA
jgi:hypothetical protein